MCHRHHSFIIIINGCSGRSEHRAIEQLKLQLRFHRAEEIILQNWIKRATHANEMMKQKRLNEKIDSKFITMKVLVEGSIVKYKYVMFNEMRINSVVYKSCTQRKYSFGLIGVKSTMIQFAHTRDKFAEAHAWHNLLLTRLAYTCTRTCSLQCNVIFGVTC